MKKRIFSFFSVLCMIILSFVCLTSCGKELNNSKEQKLLSPVVTLKDNVATWSIDLNADKFEISLDGHLSYVENTVSSQILTNGQTFKIRAIGDGKAYTTSDWSNSVTYIFNNSNKEPLKLDTPVVSISDSGIASWSNVTNASGYLYRIDNEEEIRTNSTSIKLIDGQSITVKAIGDGTNYIDSDYSSSKIYKVDTPIIEPIKLSVPIVTISDSGIASWSNVTNASGYLYKIDNGEEKRTNSTSIELIDGQSITVKALGDGSNYIDSDYSLSKIFIDNRKEAEVIVDEYFLEGELVSENGKNSAKITVLSYFENDASAYFESLEIYNGETLVLKDDEYEGYAEYYELNSNTEYSIKIYYSSENHGYRNRIKEVKTKTPAYSLPNIEAYSSDKNIVVGRHSIFSFSIEKYTDLKYYDVIVRGYKQNDAYFAPFIVDMINDPTLLDKLQAESDKHYMRPGGYIWEAEHYINMYYNYLQALEHKERMGYSDDKWREIASLEKQYVYELSIDNEGLFIANDGDFVYNYYAVLRDYFIHEDIRFEIYLNFDLGDGLGIKEINMYTAYPYFHEVSDDNYGFNIEIDENVKNGYIFQETDMDYKVLYVHRLALYKDNSFVCYVPFEVNDITSIDMDAWLEEWIEKLKCEIANVTIEQMIKKIGNEIVRDIFDELWFEEEFGNDIVVDENVVTELVDGSKLGNQRERDLLTALSSVDPELMLSLFKAKSNENMSLESFIEMSNNSTIISVLNEFRDQIEITDQNAYAIYNAINSIYDVYDQLKNVYDSYIREEYKNKEVTDLIETIPLISFKFITGLNLAPAGEYELRVLYRSILEDYKEDDDFKGCSINYIQIKKDLEAPKNIRFEGNNILWDVVEGASEYIIYVNKEEFYHTYDNYYSNYGNIKNGDMIKIVATGYFAYDSEPSDEVIYIQPKLKAPAVTVSGRTIRWNTVENATKYVYIVNGQQYETYDTNIYVYESGIVRIKAVDENGMYLDSDWTSVNVNIGSADKEK